LKRSASKKSPGPGVQGAGYSGTALWKKLGYKTGVTAYLDGAPDRYVSLLALPADIVVNWLATPKPGMDFVHVFAASSSALKAKVQSYRKQIALDGIIWISWPKKSSGVATDISENGIREAILPLGMVDIKVCAVDEVWSGLKFVIRRQLR
jgi:hypothetical protein